MSRSGSQTAKRLPGTGVRIEDRSVRRMLDPGPDAGSGVQPIQPARQATAQLREDWFERTYERVRDFLDDMFR